MASPTSNTENERGTPKKDPTSFVIEELEKTEKTFINEITGEKNSRVYQAIAVRNLPSSEQVKSFAAQSNHLQISSEKFFKSFQFDKLKADNINDVKRNLEDFLKEFVSYALNAAELISQTNEGSKNRRTPLGKLIDDTHKKHKINADRNPFIFAVQRLPRYQILLQELISKMKNDDPRAAIVSDLLKSVKQYSTHYNAVYGVFELMSKNKDKFTDADYQILKEKMLIAMPDADSIREIFTKEVVSKINSTKGENQKLIDSINGSIHRLIELNAPAPDDLDELAALGEGITVDPDKKLTDAELDELIKIAEENLPKQKVDEARSAPGAEPAPDLKGNLGKSIKAYLNEKGHPVSHMKMADSMHAMLSANPPKSNEEIVSKAMELKRQLAESSKLKRMVFRTTGGTLDRVINDFIKSQPQAVIERVSLAALLNDTQKNMDKMYGKGTLSEKNNVFENAAKSLMSNPNANAEDVRQLIASTCNSRLNDPGADLNKADRKFLSDAAKNLEKFKTSNAPEVAPEERQTRRP